MRTAIGWLAVVAGVSSALWAAGPVSKPTPGGAAAAPTSIPLGPPTPGPVGPVQVDWWSAAKSPAYSKAAAHTPHFDDKTLWPGLSGKEYYLKEQWPKARLLVWANPGKRGVPMPKSGSLRKDDLCVTDPANWAEYSPDGAGAPQSRPATRLWDKDTDIVLPDWDKPYEVTMRDCGVKQEFRHITVGRNAGFGGGGDGVGRQIYGNVWIRKDGKMGTQGATSLLGGRHTFFRNDNDPRGRDDRGPDWGYFAVTQYFNFNKEGGASTEYIGCMQTGDEFGINACMVIVGPDSRLKPGRNASPKIAQGGTLALMDNAVFANWSNSMENPDMTVDGTMQGGLPERPLTRPCTFGLAFKNYTNAQWTGPKRNEMRPIARTVCMALTGSSALRSYSAKPGAKLIIGTMGEVGDWDRRAPRGSAYEKEQVRRGDGGFHLWYDNLPRGSDIFFAAGATVDNVQFDYIRKGGLLMPDTSAVKSWKNVTYGPNCLGKPDELPGTLAKLDRGWHY